MVRTGTVVAKQGDTLTVVFERLEACESCQGCQSRGCANVELRGEAEIGDAVEVEMPDRRIVKASAIAYLVPLALLVAGLLLGTALHGALGIGWNPDLFAAATGGVLCIIGILTVQGIDRRLRKKESWQPRIVSVTPGSGTPPNKTI